MRVLLEVELLDALMADPGRLLSTRQELLRAIWGDSAYRDPRAIDVRIRHLREKLEPEPDKPRRILTVEAAGYRLRGGVVLPAWMPIVSITSDGGPAIASHRLRRRAARRSAATSSLLRPHHHPSATPLGTTGFHAGNTDARVERDRGRVPSVCADASSARWS